MKMDPLIFSFVSVTAHPTHSQVYHTSTPHIYAFKITSKVKCKRVTTIYVNKCLQLHGEHLCNFTITQ